MAKAGDVAVVRTGGFWSWLIRLGTRSRYDHVAVFTDDHGGIVEAEPGGVRTGNIAEYPTAYIQTNAGQPKTDAQRAAVVALALAFVRRPYDWAAISADAGNVFDLRDSFVHEWLPGTVPTKVVCSSLASYVYRKAGLSEPAGGRFCTPADWARFIAINRFSQ